MNKSSYYTQVDFDELAAAQSYAELVAPILRVLARMPQPVGQVSGPITTGGAGSIEENMKRFDAVTHELTRQGIAMIDLVPAHEHIQRLMNESSLNGYDYGLLNEFFLPLFESGLIAGLYMLPDWQSSTGATWEHEQAQRLGMNITYLNETL